MPQALKKSCIKLTQPRHSWSWIELVFNLVFHPDSQKSCYWFLQIQTCWNKTLCNFLSVSELKVAPLVAILSTTNAHCVEKYPNPNGACSVIWFSYTRNPPTMCASIAPKSLNTSTIWMSIFVPVNVCLKCISRLPTPLIIVGHLLVLCKRFYIVLAVNKFETSLPILGT